MAGNKSRETPTSSPNSQQLYSKDTVQTRRLRLRYSARHESSKTPHETCQYGPSSSTRPQMSVSRTKSSVMSHSCSEPSSSGPKLTKTGRISKAKKGVRDAHTCRQCGKVRASRSCSVHDDRTLFYPSKNKTTNRPYSRTFLPLLSNIL